MHGGVICVLFHSYCISLALSNTVDFSFGFRAISSTSAFPPAEAALMRGGRASEVRLLKNVTVLHLAALHGADEVGPGVEF